MIACYNNRPAVAALLLDHGADPHATIRDGDTALSCARRHDAFPPELLHQLELLSGIGGHGHGPPQAAAHRAGHGEPGTAAAEQEMLERAIALSLGGAAGAAEAGGGGAAV